MSLTLTENAVEAVKTLVEASPEASGMRITTSDGEGANPYQLSGAALPAEGDEVIEEDGARVFLDAAVARDLDDKALHARIGSGQRIAFFLSKA
jgi:iron-sulfur cluster assembly protein